jgi:opacity protein-like surface antigen
LFFVHIVYDNDPVIRNHKEVSSVPRLKLIAYLIIISLTVFSDLACAAVIIYSPVVAQHKNRGEKTLLLQTSPQELSNQYVTNTKTDTSYGGQLFLGSEPYKQAYFKINLGITFGFFNSLNTDGVVNQFALPDFDNLNYRYSVRNLSAMATMRVLFLPSKKWQPYIDGGVGFANNEASGYNETPRIMGAEATSPFSDHSTNSFAYSIGAGLMYHLNQVLSLGIGYQYADLGTAKLGVSADQQTTQTLSNHISLNQLLLSLSWNI